MGRHLTEHHVDCGSGRVESAGRWYRENRDRCPRPIVGHLVQAFGLTGPVEAVEAIRMANSGGPNADS